LCVRALAGFVRWAPRPVAGATLKGLGEVAWATRSNDRRRALEQLAAAYPAMPRGERQGLARTCFVQLGRNLVDAARGDVAVVADRADLRRLQQAREGGRPLLILTAHLGCWELLGRFLAGVLGELGVVTADPHNPRVDAWLRRERLRLGLTPFDRRHDVLAAVRWLRSGHPLAVLGDHRGAVASLSAPWFGRAAPTPRGPAWIALATSARIVPAGIRREGEGHRVMLGGEIVPEDHAGEAALVARCNAALEELICRAPSEWTWFHDRYGDRR
jgi:KDO2-lipid IV(A) lauroyltransferase